MTAGVQEEGETPGLAGGKRVCRPSLDSRHSLLEGSQLAVGKGLILRQSSKLPAAELVVTGNVSAIPVSQEHFYNENWAQEQMPCSS